METTFHTQDTFTYKQLGEKGHTEYGWSTELRELIIQFSFQLVRTDTITIDSLASKLQYILYKLQESQTNATLSVGEYQDLMITLYKIIGNTRDIVSGKGEYDLSYMQIIIWYNFCPELAKYALKNFVMSEDDSHPFGSWKDIKYFCNFCKDRGLETQHPIIQYAFSLMLLQIVTDVESDIKSLCGKWTPREGSKKFGWIFEELAYIYFSEYIDTAKTPEQLIRAQKKCKMDFRKINSHHNISLNTVQIKQCNNDWSSIDHTKITSITIQKQKKAFLNINKDGTKRSENIDRVICANNFKKIIHTESIHLKGRHIAMNSFVKDAIALSIQRANGICVQDEIDLINAQWVTNGACNNSMGNIIPMVDTAGSMFLDSDAGYAAIGLGIRCAEKSVLGKRVLTFSSQAQWNNLSECNNLVDMVSHLYNVDEWGMTTNFYAAFDQILKGIIDSQITYTEATNITLAIFSDMQVDESIENSVHTLYDTMEKKYEETGIKLYGKGTKLKPPRILFWNMRSTDGFPTISSTKNVSMMSGYNPTMLNMFCKNGIQGFSTPWLSLITVLNNKRYLCLENKMKTHLGLFE